MLHARGYEQVRIHPGMSAPGMYWRVSILTADNLSDSRALPTFRNEEIVIRYTTVGLSLRVSMSLL